MLLYPELKSQTILHNIYVTEDTRFISISFENVKDVIEKSEEAKEVYIKALQEGFSLQLKLRRLREMPPVDRITTFFKEFGNVSSKMSNTEIAAFLDMSRTEYVRIFKDIDLS